MASTSSSVALNPGQACLECRHRKVKCDGVKPICARCNRLDKKCVYEQISRRLKIDVMEDRIAELESKLQALIRRPMAMEHTLIRRLVGNNSGPGHTQALVSPFLAYYSGGPRTPPTTILETSGSVTSELLLEGYASVGPRSVPESDLGRLGSDSEVPVELSESLTRVVLPFRNHFHMFMYLPRLLLRLRLPPGHTESIHPALLYSIYLAACSVGGGGMSGYESRFLAQARTESEHALAFVDRLIDFMWASVILASYFLRRGRIVEAHNMILGTVGFAMAVGLHRAPGTLGPESIILPPADEIEKHDRVVLWYALTQLEASISMRIGLPTVTPKDHQTSVEAFSSQSIQNRALRLAPDVVLQTQASSLLCTIREFIVAAGDSTTDGPHPDIHERRSMLASVLHNLRQEIPPIDHPMGLHSNELRVVTIHDEEYRARMLEAAESMARLCIAARGDEPLKLIQAQPDMVPCLHSACEVLIRDFMEQRAESAENETVILEEKEQLIMSIFDMLLDLIKIFPSTEPVINNLPELLMERGEYETI